MNEERLLLDQNKNSSLFAKPNEANLTANGGYDHYTYSQCGRYEYDHTGSQYGRYGYDHHSANQYDGNGYDHADSQCGRYGYDHQVIADMAEMDMVKLVVNMVDMVMIIKLIISIVETNLIIRVMISMVNVGVMKQVMMDMG